MKGGLRFPVGVVGMLRLVERGVEVELVVARGAGGRQLRGTG